MKEKKELNIQTLYNYLISFYYKEHVLREELAKAMKCTPRTITNYLRVIIKEHPEIITYRGAKGGVYVACKKERRKKK